MRNASIIIPVISFGICAALVSKTLWESLNMTAFWQPICSGAVISLVTLATLSYLNQRTHKSNVAATAK